MVSIQDSLSDTKPLIDVLKCCCTLDQSKTLLKLTDSISDKTLRATIAITAARGRGKSACLGLALSLAIAFGYACNTRSIIVNTSTVETGCKKVIRGD